MRRCPVCKRIYGDGTLYCYNDNYPLVDFSQEESNKEQSQQRQKAETEYKSNVPKCPTCQSTNIKKLSDINRGVHALAFGLFSKTARSQFCCNDCGYKW